MVNNLMVFHIRVGEYIVKILKRVFLRVKWC